MWKKFSLVATAGLLCCSAALASDIAAAPAAPRQAVEVQPIGRVAGQWTLDYVSGQVMPGGLPVRSELVYDNTTNETGIAYEMVPNDPNGFVGDSLWMIGDGLLDSLGFSIWNSSNSAGPLSRVDVQINFYDPFDALLGTVTVDNLVISPALAVGEAGLFEVTGLSSLGINLPYACMYAMQFSDVQGGATLLGQVIYDVPTVGESPDMFYEGPADISRGAHNLYFNGNPIANFYFAVGVTDPPALTTLWDMGPTHTVLNNGNEVWIGYLSGRIINPDYPQRWSAIPFRIEQDGATITQMDLWWWKSEPDYTANDIKYRIWRRTGLQAPTSFAEEFASGTLGTWDSPLGGRDYRAKPPADWVPYHVYQVNIPIPAGDYYLTIWAEGGNGTNGNCLAWESGCSLQAEDLEQTFMWRSTAFPTPGFAAYAPASIQPGPEMTDPDDRWNLAFTLRGTVAVCLGDLDGDGDTDLSDLAILLAAYGSTAGGDLDGDGDTDLSDLALLLSDYGCTP